MGMSSGMLSGLVKGVSTSDIISVALRIALIGICTAAFRVLFYRAKTVLNESE